MVLMFQREVADRLVALPRRKDYGRLAVARPMALPGHAAVRHPAPGLHPAAQGHLQRRGLVPLAAPLAPAEPALMERSPPAAFGPAAQMLRQSLRALGGDPAALLAAAGIGDPAAEELTIAEFAALAEALRRTTGLRAAP
jgi:16S rRNA (adenine1518-N6/adenine1519-N6)-dimethyltransferase